ncbi:MULTISPECIES: hypothetical protein [unclassified Rickettsia]|uniref:hypothetical protein n=1 Tax=unclassified Rickettsia TaxID=114295 RepID=UPI003132C832
MLKQVQHDKGKSGFPPLARMTSKIRAMQQHPWHYCVNTGSVIERPKALLHGSKINKKTRHCEEAQSTDVAIQAIPNVMRDLN